MIANIWETFLAILHEEVGSRIVETWFKAVTLDKWDAVENTVYLRAPNTFVKEWIKSNYLSLFQLHLGRLLHVESPRVAFINDTREVAAPAKNSPATSMVPAVSSFELMQDLPDDSTPTRAAALYRPTQKRIVSHINKNYTYDAFVVGPSNSLAYAAARAVTEKPGKLYNPLFIYGASGLGKTHLLHAIGNEIKKNNDKLSVLYQTTDRFVNEFINAIRFDKVPQFQTKYRTVDILLLDDIQFMARKEQTQEAFFHIFNMLHEMHKQIVFTCDSFPRDIDGLAERLRSRLSWGLVVDIYAPALETKIAILKKKAEMHGEQLADDVAQFVASRVVANIRELEGLLIRVMAFASLTKQPIGLELAKKVLERSPEQKQRVVDFEEIACHVGQHYSYTVNDLVSKGRNKHLSLARQITMFLIKKLTNKSLRDIGEFFGGRDHSTVMHAIERIESSIDSDGSLREVVERIERDIASQS